MKLFVAFASLVLAAHSYPDTFAADSCSSTVCLLENGCRCSSKISPLAADKTPQFIVLAFNDAVTDSIYNQYLLPLLSGRTNFDNKQVGATFFVPHEYSDYERVNNLYNAGFEIAAHSISHNPLSSYWESATENLLYDEFNGQRRIIAQFANIPIGDIVGARTPNLALNGDVTFGAYARAGIKYDNSWPALSNNRFFPYTLDYKSLQTCQVGTCPKESFPGTWVLPIINQVGTDGIECNALLGCTINAQSANDVRNWLLTQFNRHYQTNRAPLTLNVQSAFFGVSEFNFPGLVAFLDLLRTYNNVFVVSHKEVRDWMLNPVPLEEYTRTPPVRTASCVPTTCELMKGQETRYMKSCTACPDVFPWIGNPSGAVRS